MPLQVDVRSYENIQDMVEQTIKKFKRIDVLVYNSGAIWWASVEKTPMKRFQLMQRINPEGRRFQNSGADIEYDVLIY